MDRVPKTKKYETMILKFADVLSTAEFQMRKAGEELRAWVTESREQMPPLDVRHCAFFPRHPSLHSLQPLLPLQASDTAEDRNDAPKQTVALEPAMSTVRISTSKAKSSVPKATAKRKREEEARTAQAETEASFKSTMVAFLMKEQDFDLAQASQVASVAWQKKLTTEKKPKAKAKRPSALEAAP